MHPILGRLIVNVVLCLICFIAYSSQIFIVWPWYGRVLSIDLICLLAPFNVLVGLLLWNYFLCVNTDPGRVPDGWNPDACEDGLEVKKLTGKPRYCRMCQGYKPPRAHHCRQCNRCVLRMDHHCPWINNCVGHFNYAHFIRFLFYVDVACTYHITMVTRKVLGIMSAQYWDDPSSLELIMIIMNYVACIPVLLSVGGFSIYHFYLLLSNMTTIEGWEKDKVALMIKRGTVREVKFPYDLGVKRNVDSVLGCNPFLWCWPRPPSGSGLKYELSEKEGEAHQLEETSPRSLDLQSASPWTYQQEGFNPSLQPSNSALRQATSVARKRQRSSLPDGADSSDVPPYHPDYDRRNENGLHDDDDDDSSDEGAAYGKVRVRRGSEGFEVRSINREDMLERYLTELGEKPGRYVRYIAQSDDDDEEENDNVPLAHVAGFTSTTELATNVSDPISK